MNKKGYNLIMVMFEILVVISVIFLTFQVAKSYASSDSVDKENLAWDLSMMVNAMVGVHGDAEVEYPNNVSRFSIVMQNGGVKVFVKGESEVKQSFKRFYLPEKYSAEGTIDQGANEPISKICLKKSGYVFELKECIGNV